MTEVARNLLAALNVPDEQRFSGSMKDTPLRWHRALLEFTEGYSLSPKDILETSFDSGGYDQVVILKRIPFVSLCEHHVLPFTGTVDIAYLPDKRVVGLSKLARLVRAMSRRLQMQERLTFEIARELETHVKPLGVMVIVRGVHSCMALRGIESSGEMVTSDSRGVFRDDAPARAEVLSLLG